MSTLITDPFSFPAIPAHDPPALLHQLNSGPAPAIHHSRGWSSWAARRRQRRVLRDLAEDKHLLNDLGLTREQALDEAAKPFWR
jgi:uncharacterized protein YjiS (DUF1127 family)